MYLNGKHISEYGGKLIYRNLSSNRLSTGVKWDYYLDRPENYGSGLEFKDVKLDLILECATEEIFQNNLNEISEIFRKGGEVRFKDLPYLYKMYAKVKPEYEKIAEHHYRVELNLDSDFGISEIRTVTGSNSVSVNNKGNYRTPAKLILTVPAMQSSLTVSGFEHTLRLVNTPTNANIVIDASTGQVTINGNNAIDKVDSFHLPYLMVGSHTIRCNVNCTMQIQYYERY